MRLIPRNRRPSVLLGGLTAAALTIIPNVANGAPPDEDIGLKTIPSVQEWSPNQGTFSLTSNTRVLVPTKDAKALETVAELFAGDLAAINAGHSIVITDNQPNEHDIVLSLDKEQLDSGHESYEVSVKNSIIVKGFDVAGVFYGSRTLLQLFQQNPVIPTGDVVDAPKYRERGLMVDLGRMTLDYDWLAETIRDMAYLKLNTLHLHLTDTEGWRIESDLVTETDGALSKDELRDLVALAARYQVTIIPEVDLPSHQGKLLEDYPQYQLISPDGPQCDPLDTEWCTSEGHLIGRLDYSIPEARQLLKDVIEEYIDIFPGPYWHLGADEYLGSTEYEAFPQLLKYAQENIGPNAKANDGYIYFINEMNDFVKSHGKQARMWNDVVAPGTDPQVDTDVVIDWWTDVDSADIIGSITNGGPYVPYGPQELLDRGYQVLNSSFLPTYTSPPGGHSVCPTFVCLFSTFDVTEFMGYLYTDNTATGGDCGPMLGDYKKATNKLDGLLGSRVTMWNSTQAGVPPWSPSDGRKDIFPRLRAMAQRTWGSPELVTDVPGFQALIDEIGTNPKGATSPPKIVNVTTATRCVAGKVTLAVTVQNTSTETVVVSIKTPYGTSSNVAVDGGKVVSKAFSTRTVKIPAGELSVEVNGSNDVVVTSFTEAECK